jgi:hypothetical protein
LYGLHSHKGSGIFEWSGNLIAVSKANSSNWGLPQARLMEIENLYIEMKALYKKC